MKDKSWLGGGLPALLRNRSEGQRLLAYFLMGLAATAAVTLGAWGGGARGLSIPGQLAKLLVALAALWLAGSERRIPLRNSGKLPGYLLLCLAGPLISLIFAWGKAENKPEMGEVLFLLTALLLTALWEESVFRLWGRLLFEEKEQYKARNFLAIACIFGSMHLVNLLTLDVKTVLLETVYAILVGLFLQTLYTRSGSLGLMVLTHFALNAARQLPALWIPPESRLLAGAGGLEIIVLALFFALSAALIARQGQIILRGKPFLKLGRKKDGML